MANLIGRRRGLHHPLTLTPIVALAAFLSLPGVARGQKKHESVVQIEVRDSVGLPVAQLAPLLPAALGQGVLQRIEMLRWIGPERGRERGIVSQLAFGTRPALSLVTGLVTHQTLVAE